MSNPEDNPAAKTPMGKDAQNSGPWSWVCRKTKNGFECVNRFNIKEFSDRWNNLIQLVMVVFIPALIAILAYGWLESSRQKIEYLRIATGILSQEVREESEEQEAIRTWAVGVLDKYSPVELNGKQRIALINGKARLSNWGYGDYYFDDWQTYSGDNAEEKKSETANQKQSSNSDETGSAIIQE